MRNELQNFFIRSYRLEIEEDMWKSVVKSICKRQSVEKVSKARHSEEEQSIETLIRSSNHKEMIALA